MMWSIELLSVSIICLCHQAHMARYQRKAMLDDFIPTQGSLYKCSTRSKLECSTRCESVKGLRSFFYVQTTTDCECYGISYATSDGLSFVPSAKYYEKQGYGCASGWTQIGDSCYFTDRSQISSVEAAMAFCNTIGAYLVELETDAEWTAVSSFLFTTFDINTEWWIGITDAVQNDTWRWMSTGTVVNVETRWFIPNGRTNRPGEIYARMVYPDALLDAPSDYTKSIICEKSTEVIN